MNPSTGKLEGDYGTKNKGSINEKESIIEEKNGFKNIITLDPGQSPNAYIRDLLKE